MKFSIVTPSYNQLHYLKLCAASVADQSLVEVEHIIQDAGTGEELEKWAGSREKMRLVVEADTGMYDAINRGLRRATGDICAYLNSDEQYLPGALAKVRNFFLTHPDTDVLFGDVILVDVNGWPLSYRRVIPPTRTHIRLAHLNTPTCATFFRRRLLERGFYFDTEWRVIGDAVWIDTLLEKKVVMATIPEPLAVFTFTGQNLGATELSRTEAAKWRSRIKGSRLQRSLVVLWHRAQKAWAGAYRRRDVTIDVFTAESPDQRQRRSKKAVGFSWPS